MRTALRQEVAYASTPPALRARVTPAVNGEGAARRPRPHGERFRNWLSRPFRRGALSGIASSAIAAGIAFFVMAPGLANPLLDDLLTAHVRSLMPGHLIDVASTDRHTVKPWFAGHADVSPMVADFDGQGYRLIGGRTDYFEHQRAAVVVYQRGSHVINVFSWAGDQRGLPKNTSRNGYHLAFWTTGNLAYCAVSDTAWDELIGGALFIGSGVYNIGADDHHTKLTLAMIEQLRERSIGVRARAVEVPPLEDPKRVMAGAQSYAALCVGSHLAPGVTKSDIRPGLYPHPPNLAQEDTKDTQRAFWIIKHGIKMTSMRMFPIQFLNGANSV